MPGFFQPSVLPGAQPFEVNLRQPQPFPRIGKQPPSAPYLPSPLPVFLFRLCWVGLQERKKLAKNAG